MKAVVKYHCTSKSDLDETDYQVLERVWSNEDSPKLWAVLKNSSVCLEIQYDSVEVSYAVKSPCD